MEGKGMTAAQSPSPGDNGDQNSSSEAEVHDGEIAPQHGAVLPVDGNEPSMAANWERPRVRVDARLLEATLLNLRKRIAAVPLVFDIPGGEEVTAERGQLLSQIDDYLLPRVRQSGAPLLVALIGSTGAGKSTLVNSVVGTKVSQTGVRRPTTNSPVLACHPDDMHWFAENMFLPTLPRVRQEGLARPGRDGLLVLAASEGMTRGIALLDTPDIDSVVRAHYDFAYQFLDASDLWLFMTSASRYADAPVWELLQHARDRGAALGVVLSRVPPSHRTELVAHFNAMLDANGIQTDDRFVIPETGLVNGALPDDIFQPIRDWLDDAAQRTDRRVAVLSQTMSGILDTFKNRVPKLAAHVDAQIVLRTRLRREAEIAYASALTEFDEGIRDGRLLVGEVLARWQDYAVSGDLGTALRGKRGIGAMRRGGKRARSEGGASRYAALDTALRAAVQSLVVSVADRAAERVARVWRDNPAGAALLAVAEDSRVRDERTKREFESAFGTGPVEQLSGKEGAFDRSSPDLIARVSRVVGAWQDQLMRKLASGGQASRPPKGLPDAVLSRGKPPDPRAKPSDLPVSSGKDDLRPPWEMFDGFDGPAERTEIPDLPVSPPSAASRDSGGRDVALASVVALVAILGEPGGVLQVMPEGLATTEGKDPIATVPRELLASLMGADESAVLITTARQDLKQRVGLLLEAEMLRFNEVIDEAGPIDAVAAVRLYQAEYSLEAAR
jgi:energy-coupling factor transporter ATP-binding protein EcfA2